VPHAVRPHHSRPRTSTGALNLLCRICTTDALELLHCTCITGALELLGCTTDALQVVAVQAMQRG
jgi:hypothetical protein